jgi:hypothetical protein
MLHHIFLFLFFFQTQITIGVINRCATLNEALIWSGHPHEGAHPQKVCGIQNGANQLTINTAQRQQQQEW